MKKFNKNYQLRLRLLSAFIFGLIAFMLIAPVSIYIAAFFFAGALVMPFTPIPTGILGTGTAGVTEKTAEEKLLEKIKGEVNDIVSGKIQTTDERLKHLTTQLDKLKDYEDLKREHIELMATVKALKEIPKKDTERGYKTLGEALVAAFEEKKTEIEEIVKNGGRQEKSLKLTFKAVGTMSVASTIGAGSTQVSITQDTGIISTIRKRELRYLAEVSVGRIGTNRALWIEETDEEGTPVMLGEGAAKTQLDVQYVEQTMAVKKIAVYGKVTTELMADIPQLISYIQNNLMKRMDIALENQLFTGNNVGDNLKGIKEYATAFTGGSLANGVNNANELDVLEALALQVTEANGIANGVFIHPSTLARIKLIKDTAGRPVWKDYVTTNGELNISGLKIIATTAVTAGEFIGGDLSVVNVLIRDEMGVTIGLDGNDFTQNKKTMLMEKRLVQFVSGNDTAVLVKGDFTTAKAAIETP